MDSDFRLGEAPFLLGIFHGCEEVEGPVAQGQHPGEGEPQPPDGPVPGDFVEELLKGRH